MITEEQYKEAIRSKRKADEVINAYHKEACQRFDTRWEAFEERGLPFKDEDLIYAAFARCKKCNAGMAYPKGCGPSHQWTCSDVLKGIGTDGGHEALPFAFYEVKSENQPSANGATTRPK